LIRRLAILIEWFHDISHILQEAQGLHFKAGPYAVTPSFHILHTTLLFNMAVEKYLLPV
jgi:hypothetical protein